MRLPVGRLPFEAVRLITLPLDPANDVLISPTVTLAPEIVTALPEAIRDCVVSIEKDPTLSASASALNVMESLVGLARFSENPLAMVISLVASNKIFPV